MSNVALIPSDGRPPKHLAEVAGRTLIAHAVQVARAVEAIDEVIVSSDDPAILAEAERVGATPEHRTPRVAGDDMPTSGIVRDLLGRRDDVEVLVLLHPATPLREPEDVQACLDALAQAKAAATVTEALHPAEWLFRTTANGRLRPVLGWERMGLRQSDAETVYALNGAVFAVRAAHLRAGGRLVGPDTVAVAMPPERSVDVDDTVGLALARLLANWPP
jgi:CMP-N,N'-diacetyllegionaminic acid synthase